MFTVFFQEIAIRVFRTAHELAMHTVAIYSYEDRLSAHRQKVIVFFNWSRGCPADNSSRLMRLIKLAKVAPQLLPISLRTTSLEYPLNMELT